MRTASTSRTKIKENSFATVLTADRSTAEDTADTGPWAGPVPSAGEDTGAGSSDAALSEV